ncbi:chaperonin 10-like protein [Apiosordaria backusii]|uniref:Chaperonin 10-like protein n=1 Tax=Apiosordaria backusii TaxID=314023 RepID=A0AA40AIE8_9PEZI|nr:chaperonin 10-like protein [Apiosordaria backusii]
MLKYSALQARVVCRHLCLRHQNPPQSPPWRLFATTSFYAYHKQRMEELVLFGVPTITGQRRRAPIPKPGTDEVLIKVVATGLNPKDWKWTRNRDQDQAMNAGDDIAGIIESVGNKVFEYKPGDRVAAFHRMAGPGGAYAEYAIAPFSTTFHLPPNVSFEAGAGLPLSSMTAAIGLYQALQLPLPSVVGKKYLPLVIYGGATAVGAYALQFAKLSNVGPIITVAGSGIDFVKSLGAADHIIDYRQGNVTEAIIAALDGNKVHHILDAVSSRKSHEPLTEVLVASGAASSICWTLRKDKNWQWPESVNFTRTFVASAYSEKHAHISQAQANADGEFAYFFYRYMTYLMAEGKFKPHPHEVLPKGLDGIADGNRRLSEGKVSATKLVARIADTPGL